MTAPSASGPICAGPSEATVTAWSTLDGDTDRLLGAELGHGTNDPLNRLSEGEFYDNEPAGDGRIQNADVGHNSRPSSSCLASSARAARFTGGAAFLPISAGCARMTGDQRIFETVVGGFVDTGRSDFRSVRHLGPYQEACIYRLPKVGFRDIASFAERSVWAFQVEEIKIDEALFLVLIGPGSFLAAVDEAKLQAHWRGPSRADPIQTRQYGQAGNS